MSDEKHQLEICDLFNNIISKIDELHLHPRNKRLKPAIVIQKNIYISLFLYTSECRAHRTICDQIIYTTSHFNIPQHALIYI
jgi:hypothetical protein